jgi:hypothetical protein
MSERLIRITADSGGDGYDLYEALKDGKRQPIEFQGATYAMQFCGVSYGSDNYLLVEAEDGTQKRWGWGWNSDVCFQCLRDLRKGWSNQKERYNPYRVKVEVVEA